MTGGGLERMYDTPEYAHALVYFDKLGIRVEEFAPDRVVGSMPVEGNTQPHGLLHGGATCSLVETLASMGAGLVAGPERIAMGQQQSTHFLATATEGTVRGIATPIHTGRTSHVWNVDVFHIESGKKIATSRMSLAVRPHRK